MKNHPIIVFGEVLFDQFPDGGSVLGGAPFNVAWHLQALGQSPQFISRVGTDPLGNRIHKAMDSWGMTLDFLQEDPAFPTGQVQVIINHGEPAYSILADQAYDRIQLQGLENIGRTGILYHGTLATRSETSRQTLLSLKNRHQGKIFVDVNMRQPWWDKSDALQLIHDADWVKLNIHELQALQDDPTELKADLGHFLAQHNLEGAILTCGEKGAYALTKAGEFISVSPSNTTLDVVDTVGAGDAFSAIFLLGLNLGWPLTENMEKAQSFATAITRRQGATVADKSFYRPYLDSWGLI